jgi:hypothetical protein
LQEFNDEITFLCTRHARLTMVFLHPLLGIVCTCSDFAGLFPDLDID